MDRDLKLSSYHFELPSELIANRPVPGRDQSRLLSYKEKDDAITIKKFEDIIALLPPNSLLVVNDTKVFPCRLIGKRPSGGKVEVFVLDLNPDDNNSFQCLIKSSGKKREGESIIFDQMEARIEKRNEDHTFQVSFSTEKLQDYLFEFGLVPIPPYIRGGESDEKDKEDYQTVYAKDSGSVAAPTAGLHFTSSLLNKIKKERGIEIVPLTLHVGMGTFAPVKAECIEEHQMHFENFSVSSDSLELLNSGRPITAVGTTSLRVLESIFDGEKFPANLPAVNRTNIFIHPGKSVRSINGLITNFHLPQSSLLMLISAILGREKVLEIYARAIEENFRFFSYGDAMYIDLQNCDKSDS